MLKEGAVLIERVRPGPNVFSYRAMLNRNDQEIADLQPSNPDEEAVLERLFKGARDYALKPGDVFRNLVGELEVMRR